MAFAEEEGTPSRSKPKAPSRAVSELAVDPRLLEAAVQVAPEGVAVLAPTDDGLRVAFVNDAFCALTKVTRPDVLGRPPRLFGTAEADRALAAALLEPSTQRRGFKDQAMAHRADGSPFLLDLNVVPVAAPSGLLRCFVAFLRDVSDAHARMAALEYQVLHDPLTDLPNRVLLKDRVAQAILAAHAEGTAVGLLAFDLNAFREVNDTLGHSFGDELLRRVAPRVRPALRALDTLARMDGDAFAVLLPNITDTRDALKAAQALAQAFTEPFAIEDQVLSVSAGVGVGVYPNHAGDADGLLRCAEVAMYAAKERGDTYLLYAADQETSKRGNLALRVDLREAIDREQLVLHFQPAAHLQSGKVTRVEALVRWQHPERGLLPPIEFIPLAERSTLIKPLTDWVLDRALAQCRAWHDNGLAMHVAVNLPTQSLLEPFLPQRLFRVLDRWKLPPHVLKLEITESGIMADPPHVLAILHLLRTLGVRLSLDDFGTGYSSLSHMRTLPIDEIKIDKSFVMGMRHNDSDAAIVRTIISLAHSLGYEVVAEGVDDERTLKILSGLGCDLVQGFYLSPPLPPQKLLRWLHSSRWAGVGTGT